MKNYLYRSLILIVFLLPIKTRGHNDSARYVFQKKRYWELAKQPQSLRRDTLIILALDSMFTYGTRSKDIKDSDSFDYFKKFEETIAKSDWEKGKAMLLFSQGFSLGETGQYVKSIESFTKAEN